MGSAAKQNLLAWGVVLNTRLLTGHTGQSRVSLCVSQHLWRGKRNWIFFLKSKSDLLFQRDCFILTGTERHVQLQEESPSYSQNKLALFHLKEQVENGKIIAGAFVCARFVLVGIHSWGIKAAFRISFRW